MSGKVPQAEYFPRGSARYPSGELAGPSWFRAQNRFAPPDAALHGGFM
jgi:hypothetical protein